MNHAFHAFDLQAVLVRSWHYVGPASDVADFYYFVYPNLMLNILPGRLEVNRIDAMRPDQCRTIFDYYAAPGHNIEEDRAFSDGVHHFQFLLKQAYAIARDAS